MAKWFETKQGHNTQKTLIGSKVSHGYEYVLIPPKLPWLSVLLIKISEAILGICCDLYSEASNFIFAWTCAVWEETLLLSAYGVEFSTMKKKLVR